MPCVVINPVRAGMASEVADWEWSSYRACQELETAPHWLAADGLLARFGKKRSVVRQRYARFVAEGIGAASPWQSLKGRVYLGDEALIRRAQAQIQAVEDVQIPAAQRRPPPPALEDIAVKLRDRDAAIKAAYATGAYSTPGNC